MSVVEVKEPLLRWAMKRSARNIEELSAKFPKLQEWISGSSHPTLRQLERFAKATSTPLGFLFLTEPPVETLPIPHFRTISGSDTSTPSPDLIDTIRFMQRRQDWMREHMIEEGEEPLSLVAHSKYSDQPQVVAQAMRDTLGIDDDWARKHATWTDAVRHLIGMIDSVGIMVVVNGVVGNNTHRKLNPREFRGFVLVDEYAPLVFINGADSKAAQMFTLAHELAHVFLGSSAAFDLRNLQPADDPTERACDQIAAEFLVPEAALREHWILTAESTDRFQAAARKFKVSSIVAARRALDLDLVSRDDFFIYYNEYLRLDRDRRGRGAGGDFNLNQNLRIGKRFASTVARATNEGRLLYTEAYSLTGLYGTTFESYVATLQVVGGQNDH